MSFTRHCFQIKTFYAFWPFNAKAQTCESGFQSARFWRRYCYHLCVNYKNAKLSKWRRHVHVCYAFLYKVTSPSPGLTANSAFLSFSRIHVNGSFWQRCRPYTKNAKERRLRTCKRTLMEILKHYRSSHSKCAEFLRDPNKLQRFPTMSSRTNLSCVAHLSFSLIFHHRETPSEDWHNSPAMRNTACFSLF